MKRTGYAIVDIATGEVLTVASSLPTNPAPPGNPRGRIATFERVGQEAGGYRCVERLETEPVHEYQFSASITTAFNGSAVVVDKAWTYPSLDDAKRFRIKEIKAGAGKTILDRLPEWKQTNMTARQGELHRIEVGLMRDESGALTPARSLSDAEVQELVAIAGAWSWVKEIRAYSDGLEAEVMALTTAEDVCAWYIPGWPA